MERAHVTRTRAAEGRRFIMQDGKDLREDGWIDGWMNRWMDGRMNRR